MSPLGRLLVALTFVATSLAAPRADAFPSQRVHDRLWAKSQPWVTIDLPGVYAQWIWVHAVNVGATCSDPIPGRNEPLCTTPDHGFNVHVFADGLGEVSGPQMCLGADCWMQWSIPSGVTRVALLVHGTHDTRGFVSGSLHLYALNDYVRTEPLSFSGDVMLDVTSPPGNFDVETVLIPDGPIVDPWGGPDRPGNAANDFLGVDATEVWMLAGNGLMIQTDVSLSGVGFAGRMESSSFASMPYHTVLVRPWAPPPAGFTVLVGGTTRVWPTPPSAPMNVGVGRMRAILNDPYADDVDSDGLSGAVESEIGTCTGIAGWSGRTACIAASTFQASPSLAYMDPRDTDGDGLSDFAEVIGSASAVGQQARPDGGCSTAVPSTWFDANQTLPLWGFNPLHKDALIQVNMGPRYVGTTDVERTCPAIGAPDPGCNSVGGVRYGVRSVERGEPGGDA